jgi:tetrahydromethanopterin S-methyltransferase subunit D
VAVFRLPTFCVWKLILGVPCPGCGLTRAFFSLSRFRLAEAAAANILVIPILVCGAAGGVCLIAERLFHAPWLTKYNSLLASESAVFIAAILAVLSLSYNILAGN